MLCVCVCVTAFCPFEESCWNVFIDDWQGCGKDVIVGMWSMLVGEQAWRVFNVNMKNEITEKS